jgi:hypothetical protein
MADYAQMVRDAEAAAAGKLRQSVRPRGVAREGRQEGAATEFLRSMEPQTPAEAAFQIATSIAPMTGLPLRVGGKLAAAGLGALGLMLTPDEAQAGFRKAMQSAGRALFPQYAEHYPPVGPPKMKTDPETGKVYPGKEPTPEAKAFQKERTKIRKEMEAEGFEPYYDPAKRFPVEVKHYPPNVDTTQAVYKKQATIDEYLKHIDAPETRQRLREAAARGMDLGDTDHWYWMGQLERDFVKELGAKPGREAFKQRFATSMAATTGGSTPETNFLSAMYGNYLRQHGLPYPTASHELPVPIGGGKQGISNIAQHQMIFDEGGFSRLGLEKAKRHDFAWDFMGGNRPVIDEQMAAGMFPEGGPTVVQSNKGWSPRPGTYGLFSRVVSDEAARAGWSPESYQGSSWYGFKNVIGKPMIQTVNEAIERTHQLTGMARDEIVRRGIIRNEIPIYGLGAVSVPSLLRVDRENLQTDNPTRQGPALP